MGLAISGAKPVQGIPTEEPQLSLPGLSKLSSPGSFVVRTERVSIPRSAAVDSGIPGHALAVVFAGEGNLQMPFDVLSSEFSRALAAERSNQNDPNKASDRNVEYIEYKVVQSAHRQAMLCISDTSHPARVRSEQFELSYFARNQQLNFDVAPSATVFYSLQQILQPLPANARHATILESWKRSQHPVAQDVVMTRLESPDDAFVRYSIITTAGNSEHPDACWMRTSGDDNSLLFSVYDYVQATVGLEVRWRPACVLQMQAVSTHFEVERLTIREFTFTVTDDDARLWIELPRTIMDVRGAPAQTIESLSGLPPSALEMLVIEKPR